MAGHRLIATVGTRPQEQVDAYLDGLADLLHGPRRRRAQILAELRDGLEQAIADHATAGRTAEQAAASAIDRFGTPHVVAEAFAGNWPPPTPGTPSAGTSPPDPSSASAGSCCSTRTPGAPGCSRCWPQSPSSP
jgi:hypothetical protein